MRIMLYLAIILFGAFLGARGKLPDSFTGKLSKLQSASLLVLLFIMGLNIGVNDDVVKKFYMLGFQAVVMAVLSIILSIVLVRLVAGFIKQGKRGSE